MNCYRPVEVPVYAVVDKDLTVTGLDLEDAIDVAAFMRLAGYSPKIENVGTRFSHYELLPYKTITNADGTTTTIYAHYF